MTIGKGSYEQFTEFNYFAEKLTHMNRLTKPTE